LLVAQTFANLGHHDGPARLLPTAAHAITVPSAGEIACDTQSGSGSQSLALLGQHGAALAQSQDKTSANNIMPGCPYSLESGNQRDTFMQGVCTGIIAMMFYYGESHFGFCSPKGANIGQAKRVVAPGGLHLSAWDC
jgi:hypothetical protein